MTIFSRSPVRVRVPATSANLGPGFDALGLALTLYDEVEAWVPEAGLSVDVAGEGDGALARDADDLVVRAARTTFDRLGVAPPGLALRCTNRIPHGRGLGSSAAAIVAGVLAARALVPGAGMTDAEVFASAVAMEGHPDNVAACLAGGVAIAWGEAEGSRWAGLAPDASLAPVAIVPEEGLPTRQARGLLPEHVPHRDAAVNAGRAALLVAALTGRPDLLLDATEDRLHQSYRAAAMPRTAELLGKLRTSGVPAVISGSGPTIVALAQGDMAGSIGRDVDNGWHVYPLGVDREGARVQTEVHDTRIRQ